MDRVETKVQYIDKIVEVEKKVNILVNNEKIVHVDRIVEVPMETVKFKEVEKIVERPVEVVKVVEVEKIVEVVKEVEKIITREEEDCDCLIGLRFIDVWNKIFHIKGMAIGECLTEPQFVQKKGIGHRGGLCWPGGGYRQQQWYRCFDFWWPSRPTFFSTRFA